MRRTHSAPRTGLAWRWILVTVIVLSAVGFAIAREGSKMPKDEALSGSAAKVRIDQPVVAVRLPTPKSGPAAGRLRQALAGEGRAELVLGGMTVSAPPGVLFNVFLSTTGPSPRRQYAGTLSFYGVGYGSAQKGLPDRTFDVTEDLQALKGTSSDLPEIQVVFEATDGTADSTPQKARASFNREAGLQVGLIRLQIH